MWPSPRVLGAADEIAGVALAASRSWRAGGSSKVVSSHGLGLAPDRAELVHVVLAAGVGGVWASTAS